MTFKPSYTLIELCVVLAIITMLCMLGIPMIVMSGEREILRELDKLEAVFLYLHQRAIATQSDHELIIDTKQNTYTYKTATNKAVFQLSSNIIFGWLPAALGPPGDPTALITQACSFPKGNNQELCFSARFLSNGQFYPGTVYLIDRNRRFMGALTCSISRVFYIRKYLYKSEQWLAQAT